jgi:hypothetical protein
MIAIFTVELLSTENGLESIYKEYDSRELQMEPSIVVDLYA